ncbi:MAG: phosphonate ABC transporter ATP-binding protein [Candidatus Tectomicrobia bacterium]|uniref:Phosphonate ABC transporter ATP-binding protein n=1 Tax=Tectimicrobiota bacterium TaxID=2528274 RepID=A0A932M126_UNCTE|nr:phosphonate ABC transporter ATP-binding protein [Candidatus Tectomicrobia bacterium]
MAPSIEIENLVKVFDGRVAALDSLSLQVEEGEKVALIGPSGAGKTTLFRLLNCILTPTRGTLRLQGCDVTRLSEKSLRELRARIGTIYQQHNLVPQLRVAHNVLAGKLGRLSTARALWNFWDPRPDGDVVRALTQVGIAGKYWERTAALSGGQQQRVAVARALVQNPDILLADEPVSSVDPALAQEIVSLLADLAQEGGKTLVVSLHSVELALAHFPRIVGLRGGKLYFDLPPDQITAELLSGLFTRCEAERGVPERVLRGAVSPVFPLDSPYDKA